jgi:GWxTD domain-containing protein
MRKSSMVFVLLFTVLLVTPTVAAQSLPELFRQAKQQVGAGSWAEAMATLATLESEADKPGLEQSRKDLDGPIQFYRGVCEANLGRTDEAIADFGAFLRIQPDAAIDPAVYSKKAVAAFDKARELAADRALHLPEAYKEFRPPADAAERDPVDSYWAGGPVKWILTPEEMAEWSSITDPNARVAFVERFWDARSTLPGSEGRTFREEFERRVAFADAHLARDGEPRGSVTDRGMVFILLGPPTYATRRPLRTGDDQSDNAGMFAAGSQDRKLAMKKASTDGTRKMSDKVLSYQYEGPGNTAVETYSHVETWRYRGERLPAGVPYQKVDVHYVSKRGYGKDVMQRDPEALNTLRAAAKLVGPVIQP